MRLNRAVSLVMAVLLAATLSQALMAPSQASPAPAAHQALMKPNHDLRAGATEVGNDHFVIYGSLTTYPRVGIYRSIAGGAFRLYRKVKVQDNGRFRTRLPVPEPPDLLPGGRAGDQLLRPGHQGGRLHRHQVMS